MITRRPFLACALALLLALPAAFGVRAERKPGTEIVNGTIVTEGKYPFMAAVDAISDPGNYWCGGTLITPRSVLTAAHCLSNDADDGYRPASDLRVAFGILDRDTIPDSAWIAVSAIYPHPGFVHNPNVQPWDAAVLELAEPVRGVQVVLLPEAGSRASERTGTKVTALGWGARRYLGPRYTELREGPIVVRSAQTCKQRFNDYTSATFVVHTMICADAPGIGICSGDSGGPLLAKHGRRWVQVGISSGSIGCATTGWPGQFARVSNPSINDWIREHANLK